MFRTIRSVFIVLFYVLLVYVCFLCQYHAILVTVALSYILKLCSMMPPALLKIGLVIWHLS